MFKYRNTDALIVNTKTAFFKLRFLKNISKMKGIKATNQK